MDTEFNPLYEPAMTDHNFEPCDSGADVAPAPATLEWRTRYNGHVEQAYLGDKAVAGISGPWAGKFALTWWDRPLPARQLELHDSLEEAKREVEAWLLRMRSGQVSVMPAAMPVTLPVPAAPVAARVGLFERVRRRWMGSAPSPSHTIDRLRRARGEQTPDLGGLHFGALDL